MKEFRRNRKGIIKPETWLNIFLVGFVIFFLLMIFFVKNYSELIAFILAFIVVGFVGGTFIKIYFPKRKVSKFSRPFFALPFIVSLVALIVTLIFGQICFSLFLLLSSLFFGMDFIKKEQNALGGMIAAKWGRSIRKRLRIKPT